LRKLYGAGEVPIVAADGSGANAINNAIGVRMRDEPMSPPRLCAAIDQQEPVRRAAVAVAPSLRGAAGAAAISAATLRSQ